MKELITKKNLIPIAVLSVICLVVAAILGAVYLVAAPIIKEAEAQKVYDSLREVLDGTFEEIDKPSGAADTVTAVYKVTDDGALVGHVVTLSAKGYASTILLTVGIDADGKVTKAVITAQGETHGKAGMATYTDSFSGVAPDALTEVDTFSGATISSTAIKNAVIDAVNAVTGGEIVAPDNGGAEEESKPIEMPKTEDEVISLAKTLSGATSLEDVTPGYNKPETLLKLYSANNGGYVAYIVTPGAYVPVANEILVYIDVDGNVAAINHLAWVVGHGVGADGFAEQFVGKDNWNVDGVDLISGATGTSSDFKTAVAAALDVVAKMTDRTEKKLLEFADKMVDNARGFEKIEVPADAPNELKRIYRETSGKGYVAQIVTSGQYVAVAAEALVYVDTLGTIKDVELLIWNVGHGVEPGDFAEGFIGKDKDTVKDTELVTSATGTSLDLRNAVEASLPYIPTDFPVARFVGITVAAIAFVLSVAAVIYFKRRNY